MASRKRHPGTIERRGNSLRVTIYAGGKPNKFTLRTTDVREACEFAKRKHEELQREAGRAHAGLPIRMRMTDLLDKFETDCFHDLAPSTRLAYRTSLAGFRAFFLERLSNPRVEAVAAGHINDFLNWRRGCHSGRLVSNRTIQKDRAVLHAVFAMAVRLEWRESNPVARTKPPRAPTRTPVLISVEEYERLLAACGTERPMLRLYVLTLGETGARCESEVLHLRWEDVDLEGGFIKIVSGRQGHRTKSGRTRDVPMTSVLRHAMRDHFARYRLSTPGGTQTPWVFHHEFARRRAKIGTRIRSLRTAFIAASKRADLPTEFHQHDLRHRRVTTWIAEGRDVALVREAVGHADLRTTMGYTHLVRENLVALVDDTCRRPQRQVAK
jgi:integrase/recombinase XerD